MGDTAYVAWRKTKAAAGGRSAGRGGAEAGHQTWTGLRAGGVNAEENWRQRIVKEQGIQQRYGTVPAAGAVQPVPDDADNRASDASIRSLVDRLAPGWQAAENAAAATELAQLCNGTAARKRVLKLNPVPTLVGLLARGNEAVLEPCCSCLYKLAQDDHGRRIINAAGAARPLVQALSSRRSAVVREACGALWNLGHRSEDAVKHMLAAQVVPALVRLLSRCNDEQAVLRALGALANIAANTAGRQAIAAPGSGAIAAMTHLLRPDSNGAAVCKAAVRLLAHLTHGPRDRTSISVAHQLGAAKAVPIIVSLLSAAACRNDAATCLGNLGKEGKLKRQIVDAVAADVKTGGGVASAAALLAKEPRSRSSVSRGPSWHPRTVPNVARTTGLGGPNHRPSTAPSGGKKVEKVRRLADGSIERPRSWFTSSVEQSGYWRERLAKEDMSPAELHQSLSHCRNGGRVATRQPRPWSVYMPDTSGNWGHVSSEGVANDTL